MQVKITDSDLVKWAVFQMKLKILGRKKWAFRCACHEPDPKDPRECLAASARLADEALGIVGLKEDGAQRSPSTGSMTGKDTQ